MNKKLVVGVAILVLCIVAYLAYMGFNEYFEGGVEPNVEADKVAEAGNDETVEKPGKESAPAFEYSYTDAIKSAKGASFSVFTIEHNKLLADRITFQKLNGQSISDFIINMRNKTTPDPAIFTSDNDFFAITGAMFDIDNMPPGLVISKGVQLKGINDQIGQGNFYDPQPNGVFYVDSKKAGIDPTDRYNRITSPEFALQSGPMLVIDGGINPNLNPNSDKENYRCAIGIAYSNASKKATLKFVSSRSKVTFYELANFMKMSLGCKDAMHLESVNAFISFPGSSYPRRDLQVRNFIVIK